MRVTMKSRQDTCWVPKVFYRERLGCGMAINHAGVHNHETVHYT